MAAFCAVSLATLPALAQSAPPQDQPTVKDRLDKAVSTITGDPLKNADVDMKHLLDAFASLKPKPIETLSPQEARQQPTMADAVKALLQKQGRSTAPEGGVTTKDITYEGPGGAQKARVYTPDGAQGPLPVVVYYHGGGFVIADINVYDATPRAMAKQVNAVVVSVEYRRAPEAKFPAAHDDAFAAYQWVLKNAQSLGGDPARIAVMGESAGGNLAINVAIIARDRNVQAPLHMALIYPVAGIDMNTESYKENANAKPLNKAMMDWFVRNLVRSDADLQDPRIDLLGKANLQHLPPATVITAQIDPLRSDGQMLADKLKAAGVQVAAHNYDGVTHEFFGTAAVVADAKDAQAVVAADLKRSLDKRAGTTGTR